MAAPLRIAAVAVVVLIVAVAAALYLAGGREEIVIRVEYGEPWVDLVKPALQAFQQWAEENGYRVRVEEIVIPAGVDIAGRITQDFAAGTAGDVVIVDSFLIPSYAEAGYLYPLDEFISQWPDWAKFAEPMKEMVTWKGKIYAVMVDTDVRMIWYRKDIFKIAGLPEDWQPTTWDDIIEAARKLKQAEEEIKAQLGVDEFYPFYIPAGTVWAEGTTAQGFYMLLLGADKPPLNRLYDYQNDKWICKSTALYRAFKFYIDIYGQGLGPVDYNFAEDVWATHRKVFAEGKVAMDVGGSWEWNEGWGPNGVAPIPNREQVVGWAKMPGYSGGAGGEPRFVTVSGGWAVALNANLEGSGDKLKLAWKLVEFIASKENIAKYAAKYGKIAPRTDAVEVPEYGNDPYLSRVTQELLPITSYRDALPEYPDVSRIIQEVTESIVKGEITDPQQALDTYCQKLKDKVGADRVIEYPVTGS